MRSVPRSLSLAFLALGLLATSCVEDGASIVIEGPITPDIGDEGCTYSSSTTTFILSGYYVPSYGNNYQMVLKFQNQVRARASDTSAETGSVRIEGAEISMMFTDGNLVGLTDPDTLLPLPNPYTVTATGRADAAASASSTAAGLASFNATPEAYRRALASFVASSGELEIVLGISLHVKTAGGIEQQTADYLWPVTVLNTGLYYCAASADDAGGSCALGVDFTTAVAPGTTLCP